VQEFPPMMTDPIADMLTRIRNANRIESPAVDMPSTKLKTHIAQVLKDEGFILDYHVGKQATNEQGRSYFHTPAEDAEPKKILRVFLKYGPEGERVIRHIERASKPGRRLYFGYKELRPILGGLGISVLSTSRGVLSDRQARAQRLGGEMLCTVW
jgi:small subunit ribosomal protein S8